MTKSKSKKDKKPVTPVGFLEDRREDKPGLHLLYVKWGCQHLRAIDNCIKQLGAFSNGNLHDTIMALAEQRQKLVTENAAYADAHEILEMVLHPKRHRKNELAALATAACGCHNGEECGHCRER